MNKFNLQFFASEDFEDIDVSDISVEDYYGEEIETETEEGTPTETETVSETEESETEDKEESKEEDKKSEDTPADTIEVIYNSEKKTVTKEEAIPLIQKGMNYDKIKDMYENDEARAFIKELAEADGKSVHDFLEYSRNEIKEARIKALMEEKNISEEVARELYESKVKINNTNALERSMQQRNEEQEQKNKEFQEFLKTYPDVDPKSIEKEVWQKVQQGVPLKYAYMENELNKLRDENSTLKTNEKNRKEEVKVGNTNLETTVKDIYAEAWESAD